MYVHLKPFFEDSQPCFYCFWTSCFVSIVWSGLGIYLGFFCLYVWLVSLSLFWVLVAVFFSVSSEYFLMLNFTILSCCLSFLSANQVWVPTRVLTFCLWSSRGSRCFLLTNFAPGYIKTFNSVMLMSFIGLFVNKSFTFSVSDLTVLKSWFLRESNVVFFSDMILQMVSILFFFLLDHCLLLCVCSAWVIVMECLWSLSRLLWYEFVDVFAYIFISGFLVFQCQKTNHSSLLS